MCFISEILTSKTGPKKKRSHGSHGIIVVPAIVRACSGVRT